jgi:hypothetical protein
MIGSKVDAREGEERQLINKHIQRVFEKKRCRRLRVAYQKIRLNSIISARQYLILLDHIQIYMGILIQNLLGQNQWVHVLQN